MVEWEKTKTRLYIGRISTVERELGSQRIATFIESNHDPSCYVGDTALPCTAPVDEEQTIGQNLTMLMRMESLSFLKDQQYLDAYRQISTLAEVLFPNKGIAQGITYIGPSGRSFCRRATLLEFFKSPICYKFLQGNFFCDI